MNQSNCLKIIISISGYACVILTNKFKTGEYMCFTLGVQRNPYRVTKPVSNFMSRTF